MSTRKVTWIQPRIDSRTGAGSTVWKLVIVQRLASVAMLCLVLGFGAALRFYDLGTEGYWVDEVKMVRLSSGGPDAVLADFREYGRPPVFVLLAYLWIEAFGTSEVATRSLTALFSAASLPVIYLIGRKLFDRQVALLSAFLMGISQYHVYLAQEFRYYSLFVLLSLLSVLFYLEALESGKKRHLALFALFSVLSFYSHTFAVFTVIAQAAHFVSQWRNHAHLRSMWLISQVVVLGAVAQNLIIPMIRQWIRVAETTPGAALTIPGPVHIMETPPLAPLYTLFEFLFPTATPPSIPLLISEAAIFAIIIVVYNALKGRDRLLKTVYGFHADIIKLLDKKKGAMLLCGLWLSVPILLPFVISLTLKPIYTDRYLSAASPALYLLCALAISTARKAVPQLLSVALVAIMVAPGMYQYYATTTNDQWREVAAYIEENGRSGDTIVFAPDNVLGDRLNSLNWYYRGNLPECKLLLSLESEQGIARELAGCVSDHDRFWLVLHNWPGAKYVPLFNSFFLDRHHEDLRMVTEKNFNWYGVYLFEVKDHDQG